MGWILHEKSGDSNDFFSLTMTTLSEIVNIEEDVLATKFELEASYRYDPEQKENLVFLSPTVLLEDLELRDGGLKDRGPKEVLSRLTKDMSSSKSYSFFQVPEIPYLHMGYGKSSENKKHNMALTENEAKIWMTFLDLTGRKKPGEVLREGETPMEVEVTFPTSERPEDYHAFEFEKGDEEELIDPNNSGLKCRVKGSYLLFFSILLIFFAKKNPPPEAEHEEEKIGPNKMSDFLLFWIIPYLLNFTHQKVNAINAHHAECKRQSGEEGEPFKVPTVEWSAMDIIQESLRSCKVPRELQKSLMDKYRKYYGTEQLNRKYNLPASKANTPIILVPFRYKVTDVPAIEHLGTKWQKIGDVRLVDEFISKFIESEEIQTDFLNSFGYLTDRFGTDYGIILPDEETFTELIEKIEDDHPDIFRRVPGQGRNLVSPRLGVIKHTERNQSVCFSFFQGIESHDVAVLFKVMSSNRLGHFTLAILHGACINYGDPKCKLLSLYPVKSCRRFLFKDGKLQKRKSDGGSEEKFDVGKFCRIEFPETFNSWEQEIQRDCSVMKVISGSKVKLNVPKYERQPLQQVAYSKRQHQSKLRNTVFKAAVAQNPQQLEDCIMRAANLDGCLLSRISRSARPNGVGVVLAINDILSPVGVCLPSLPAVMKRVITHFVRAVIIAGLPSVFPPEPEREVEDGGGVCEESTPLEDDDDEASDDEQPAVSGAISSGEGGIGASSSSSETVPRGYKEMEDEESQLPTTSGASSSVSPPTEVTVQPAFKEGKPNDRELDDLAGGIGEKWEKLGIHLGISNEVLQEIAANAKDKPFAMLLRWRDSTDSDRPYRDLYNALCHKRVGLNNLAKDFCCKETT